MLAFVWWVGSAWMQSTVFETHMFLFLSFLFLFLFPAKSCSHLMVDHVRKTCTLFIYLWNSIFVWRSLREAIFGDGSPNVFLVTHTFVNKCCEKSTHLRLAD
jgi:hypothetical protein